MDKIFKFLFILMDIDNDPSEEGINSPDDLREFWEEYHPDNEPHLVWEGITVIPIEHYDFDSAAIYGRSEAFYRGLSNHDTISVILSDEEEGVYVPRHPLARVRREA